MSSILFLQFLGTVTILITFCYGFSDSGCIKSEREALFRFKQDLIDPANLLASWTGDGNCCRWAGVVCDNMTSHVRELHLGNPYSSDYEDSDGSIAYHGAQLGGKLNSCLLNLKHLSYLDLSNNDFQGMQIPWFLGSMQSLKFLNLSQAGFSGRILQQLGNLSNLHGLDLSDSWLALNLHAENLEWLSGLSSLRYLSLSNVNLTNAFNWLQVTGTLPSLSALYLSGCKLHVLPDLASNVTFLSLTILDLSDNKLFSNLLIPPWLLGLNNLVSLNLGSNFFQGPIPDGLQNMTRLRELDLSNNFFNSSIPEWLYGFNHLEFLNIDYNDLEGTISNTIGNLTSAISLDLSANNLEGEIPASLGKLCNLRSIYLSFLPLNQTISDFLAILSGCILSRLELLHLIESQLSGQLTNLLGQMRSLVEIDLSGNSISGPIPESIGELSFLRSLKLSSNKLNGSLPKSLGQLENLETLQISPNLLEGVVSEVHFAKLTRLVDFEASTNNLMLNVSLDWIPPFQLQTITLASWHLGPRFPSWLHTQKKVSFLDISDSKISETIPTWFWKTSYQYNWLNLSHNQIGGTLPNFTVVFSLNISGAIDLSWNHFEGPLPCVPPSVNILDLSNNSLSGTISHFLCDGLHVSKALKVLNLRDNLLSGEIPDCWSPWTLLVAINLGNNKFTGHMPNSIGTLPFLQSMHLSKNSLSGEIPLSLENCKALNVLDLAENQLVGKIPAWIGETLWNMKVIVLRLNNFDDSIPEELCRLASLQILDLAHNRLSGNIPRCFNNFRAMKEMSKAPHNYISYDLFEGGFYDDVELIMKGELLEYGSIMDFIRSIDLSGNNLSGEIPEGMTSLIAVQSLNLSHNRFHGEIPESIDAMKSLESLDFSVNELVGKIPLSMSSLTFLNHLNLSYNFLTGKIPSSTQLQSLDASSFLGNKLCGLPLADNCNVIDVTPKVYSGRGQEHREANEFYVGMALGFVMSFWSVFGSLVINRRWRYMYFQFLNRMKYRFEDVICKFC